MSTPVTLDQAARHYEGTGLTRTAIRRAVLLGEIPHVRVGVKYLLTLENIDNWLSGSTPATAAMESDVFSHIKKP